MSMMLSRDLNGVRGLFKYRFWWQSCRIFIQILRSLVGSWRIFKDHSRPCKDPAGIFEDLGESFNSQQDHRIFAGMRRVFAIRTWRILNRIMWAIIDLYHVATLEMSACNTGCNFEVESLSSSFCKNFDFTLTPYFNK